MDPDIEQLVSAGKLTPQAGKTLSSLTAGSWCLHKSWGFGQVAERNLLLNQLVVDFDHKKGHVMQLAYAGETLQHLPDDHILVRARKSPEEVRQQAKEAPGDLVRKALADLGGTATADSLAQALAPAFPDADFKKWWASAKKRLAQDGHFDIPSKKSDPIRLREKPLSRKEELLTAFRNARQLKEQIAAAEAILKEPELAKSEAAELAPRIEEIATRNLRLNTPQALELLIARDEVAAHLDPPLPTTFPTSDALRQLERELSDILPKVAAGKVRRILAFYPVAFGDTWPEKALDLMQKSGSRLAGDIAKLLQERGEAKRLLSSLRRWINERTVSSEVLHWACRSRANGLESIVEPALLSAIISSLERDQMSDSARKGGKLQDLLMDDRELVGEILAKASPDEGRELMRKLLLTPIFDELNKRSLIARFIKQHPDLHTMISGDDESDQQQALVVSWSSLDRRKGEYEELVNKRIPQNSQEIAIARSYGDLRENFEYKAAKEMQTVLMRRKAELENELSRARGSNFDDPDTSGVSIGTVVTVRDTEGDTLAYTILGAWDSDPERHVISYLTLIGQALLGKKQGDQVDLSTDHGPRHVEILEIRAFKPGVDFTF